MQKFFSFVNLWESIKEADLKPLRQAALGGVKLALVGDEDAGREALLEAMRRDPARPEQATDTDAACLSLDQADQALAADLIILMMDSRKTQSEREQALVQSWHGHGKKVLVFIHDFGPAPARLPAGEPIQPGRGDGSTPEDAGQPGNGALPPEDANQPGSGGAISISSKMSRRISRSNPRRTPGGKRQRGVVWGSLADPLFLSQQFVPAVLELIPGLLMPLGRAFPLFRMGAAHRLINDVSFENARFAFGTALVEIIGIADLPVVVADSLVLTKNQLFLVYKLGLTLGFTPRWQSYVAEFGGVLGSGYLLRMAARTLVGLVPVIGIAPKAGIAYAGTQAIGNAVLQWYLTGRHVSPAQLKALYHQGLAQAKKLGGLFARGRTLKPPRLKTGRARLPGSGHNPQEVILPDDPPRFDDGAKTD